MSSVGAVAVPLVAVDIGNSRVKLGLFDESAATADLPRPTKSLTIGPEISAVELADWLRQCPADCAWRIASVQRSTAARLLDGLRAEKIRDVRLLSAADLPLKVDLPEPEKVGIDRLVNAVAANRLRDPGRGAVVIDIGSAITVDAVNEQGTFLGGAILGGIGMSARALHEFTDLLPLSELTELHDPPDPLGKNTIAALRSGLFWGAVGAMRELSARLGERVSHPQVFLTGGAGPSVAEFLRDSSGEPARFVPHLTLAGIALAAVS